MVALKSVVRVMFSFWWQCVSVQPCRFSNNATHARNMIPQWERSSGNTDIFFTNLKDFAVFGGYLGCHLEFRKMPNDATRASRWPWFHSFSSIRINNNMMTSSNGNIFRVTGHLCGNSPVPGEFLPRSFDGFFYLRLNKRLSKQSCGWWFETLSRPLWRHRNETWLAAGLTVKGQFLNHAIYDGTHTRSLVIECLTNMLYNISRPTLIFESLRYSRGSGISQCSISTYKLIYVSTIETKGLFQQHMN